jgi:histidyl-tRNA synthetase
MFRHERPQRGRYRQFHQIGAEALGFAGPEVDAELILLAAALWSELGLSDWRLEINSLGQPEERAQHRAQLIAYLEQHVEQLDEEARRRLHSNPLRILDAKDAGTQAVLEGAPSLLDTLSSVSRARFDQVLDLLTKLAIPFRLNPRLVRGLDYYGHTAFEITSSQLGAQATVCGGGRYDGLVGQLGGPATPAFGWALGMERLVLLVAAAGSNPGAATAPDLYVISRGEAAEALALGWARQWRQEGLAVELDLSGAAFGKQFKRADKSGARFAAVIGDSEAAEGVVLLKDLRAAAGEDRRMGPAGVASQIRAHVHA